MGDTFIETKEVEKASQKKLIRELSQGIVYDKIPKNQPSEIRIFLSSTFKGT